MSRTIDERIVEMRFDNEQFQQNIQESIDSLERLKSELDLRESAKGLDKLGKAGKSFSLASVSESVEGIASKFTTVGIVGATVLQNLTNSAVNAGKRIAMALTIDPISTGFKEYELKMNSIKTIMAGSGEDLETVKRYLEELNEYSDKTIYSFSDMTSNIGKFTNAGVKLEDAVAAIKGISNEAALAGANSNEASRAMYNFAQAMSSGYVKLIDWKSIELANMATVGFKEELIKTGVEMGTIKDLGNGMYQSLTTDLTGKQSQAFNALSMFNDSLSHQWLNKDVLVKTLSNYADETTKIGAEATRAATEVRTFTMMMDTLKESAQSGWATTWEHITGDLNAATKLFTTLSNIFGSLLQTMSDKRNAKLAEWELLGGRETLFAGFGYLHNTISEIGTLLKNAFREFFPESTGKTLLTFTEKFRDAMAEVYKFVHTNADTFESVFSAFFSVLKGGVNLIKGVARGINRLIKALNPAGEGFMGLIENIGAYIDDIGVAIQESELLENAITGIGDVVEWVSNGISGFIGFIKEAFANVDMSGVASTIHQIREEFKPLEILTDTVSNVMTAFGKALEWVKKLLTNLAESCGIALDSIGESIKNADLETFLNAINTILSGALIIGLTNMVTKIKNIFKDFGDIFGIFDNIGDIMASQVVVNIAKAMALVAASLFLLALIPSDRLMTTMATFAGMMAVLVGGVKMLDAIFDFSDKAKDLIPRMKALQQLGFSVTLLSVGLLLLAGAVKKLGGLQWNEALTGVLSLAGIMAGLVLTLKRFDDTDIPLKTAAAIFIVAMAITSLVRSVKKLGTMEGDTLFVGYVGLIGILGALLVFVNELEEKDMIKISASILAIGVALNMFTKAISVLGNMSIQGWAQGVGGIALMLLTLSVALNHMPETKDLITGVLGLIVMAGALMVMSKAISELGELDFGSMISSAGMLVAVLAILVLATKLLSGSASILLGVVSLIAMAAALRILTPALKELNEVEWSSIGKMAVALLVFAAAGAIAMAIGTGMLMLAGSIALFGLGCKMAGDGALSFGKAMEKIASSGTRAGDALVYLITEVSEAIPTLFTSIAEGIVGFASALSDGSEDIQESFTEVGGGLAAGSVDIGFKMVTSFLQGIKNGAEDLTAGFKDAVISMLESLSKHLPEMIDKVTVLVIDLLNGIADSLEKNNEDLRNASVRLGEQIGEGMVIGIESALAAVFSAGDKLSSFAITGVRIGADVHSPSDATIEIGEFIGEGMVIGLGNKTNDVYNMSYNMGKTALDGVADGANINSPPPDAIADGEFIGEGLCIGGANQFAHVEKTFAEMGHIGLDSVSGFKMDLFNIGESMAENYNDGLTRGMYAYADPLSGMREMIEKDIEDNKRQDLLDPSLWRMRKTVVKEVQSDISSMLNNIEVKTEKTRKEMTTGIGYGINHRLSMGLKLYSEQAMKAAEEAKERTLRPITDMSKNFNFDTTKIENTFARLTDNTSRLNAELELEDNVTVNHTFDKLVVEGVNNKGEFVAAADYSVEKVIASLMRRQGRV